MLVIDSDGEDAACTVAGEAESVGSEKETLNWSFHPDEGVEEPTP